MSHLQALGDSITCGEGVGVRVELRDTWSARLAEALGLGHTSLASPGRRVRDVVADQLPLACPAPVSTLLVGLNDVARPGYDLARITAGLERLVDRLTALSPTVVLGRLHDPSRVMRMPLPLAVLARRRVSAINAVVDRLASYDGVVLLDLEKVPELRRRDGWAVDRVHPSVTGQAGIARAAAAALGVELPEVPVARAPGTVARGVWCARHGAPYLAGQLIGGLATR